MNRQKIVYISGKMGEKKLSPITVKKFQDAQDLLLSQGHAVVNPADKQYQKDMKHHVAIEKKRYEKQHFQKDFDEYGQMLLYDMHIIWGCDAIYMLPDWRNSPGATAEHSYAKSCNREIIYADPSTAE